MALATFRYRGWELRPAERTLVVGGAPAQIGSRAFDVLVALAARRGEVVTKGELLELAWPGLVVEENNISVQVATLRKVLGPGAIATVPGLGYRLSAVPESLPDAPAPAEPGPARERPGAELLGRDQDLDELRHQVGQARLVSIVGTGGVGKTSLARAALARLLHEQPQAAHWIDLAPLRNPARLVPLLARALGVELDARAGDAAQLLAALGQMSGVIVIDPCEHVLAAVAGFVREALALAPGVRWVATSQAPLRVPGEIVYRLGPLAVPGGPVTLPQAMEYGAIALLCRRVVAANRRFRLDEAGVPSAVALCAQLDGLPLAIEIAAARVAASGLDDVRRRLGERRRLTLEATFEWSCGLLSPREQVVFRRLEPFLGGFRADMAQQAASDEGDPARDAWQALNAIGTLVDKSLVQRDDEAPGRFRLLESARDHARSRLEGAGEAAAVRRRHATAVAAWFGEAGADAGRMTDAEWLRRYLPERHNARAALALACEDALPDELARLVAALGMIDAFLGCGPELLQCDVPLDLLARAEPRLRASACLELGWAHHLEGDRALGSRLAQEACDIGRELGDRVVAYRALAQVARLGESQPGGAELARRAWEEFMQLGGLPVPLRTRLFCGISAGLAHRPERTLAHMRELGQLAEGAGFEALAAACAADVSDRLLAQGDDAGVVAIARRNRRLGNRLPRMRAAMLRNEALALIRLGRAGEACEPAAAAFQAMPHAARFLVDPFALAAAREGRFVDAAILHGCGANVRNERREPPDRAEADALAETRRRLAEGLDAPRLAELERLGASMSPAEALAIKVFPRRRADPAAAATMPDPSTSSWFA